MNAMNSLIPDMSSSACSAPVRTSTSAGAMRASAATSSSLEMPSFAATAIASKPSFRCRRCAVWTSKTAIVAPPIVSTSPNLATPTTRNRSTGPCATTPTESPTP